MALGGGVADLAVAWSATGHEKPRVVSGGGPTPGVVHLGLVGAGQGPFFEAGAAVEADLALELVSLEDLGSEASPGGG